MSVPSKRRLSRVFVLAAASVIATGSVFAAAPATASASNIAGSLPAHAAVPTEVATNGLTVTVDPSTDIPLRDAHINVTGKGFAGGESTLWVAVCESNSGAPTDMSGCLGGAIPGSNGSSAWGIVSKDGAAPVAGPETAKFKGKNFSISLRLPGAADAAADCVAQQCSVFIRAANPQDSTQNAAVPISFKKPDSSAPKHEPKVLSVGGETLQVGAAQTIAVTGFAPKEKVVVHLQPTGHDFGPFDSDEGGSALATFTIPADAVPGAYLATITGQKSGAKLQVSFTVTAPPPPSSPSSSPTPSSQSSSSQTVSSSTTPTSSSTPPTSSQTLSTATPTTSSTTLESTTPSPSAVTTTQPTPTTASGSGSVWWLWAVGGLATASLIVGGIVLARRRRDSDHFDDDDPPFLTPEPPPPPMPSSGLQAANYPEAAQDPEGLYLFSHAEPAEPSTQVIGAVEPGTPTQVMGPVGPTESLFPPASSEPAPPAGTGDPAATGYFTPDFSADSPDEPPRGRHSGK